MKASPKNQYTYRAIVRGVHDGDTCTVDIDQGLNTWRHGENIRILGINAIELASPGGQEAQQHLATLLPVGSAVTICTVKADKYGTRYNAAITLADGSDLATQLLAAGYAVPYTGQGVKSVPAWPIQIKPVA